MADTQVVFIHLDGCPACHATKPHVRAVQRHYGCPCGDGDRGANIDYRSCPGAVHVAWIEANAASAYWDLKWTPRAYPTFVLTRMEEAPRAIEGLHTPRQLRHWIDVLSKDWNAPEAPDPGSEEAA